VERNRQLVESARISGGHLLWPAGDPRPPAEWCDASALGSSAHARPGDRGRGATLYLDIDGRTLVLRKYHRGGMMRRLGDRYLRLGLRHSRAWRELALLARLHRAGLPVPRPIAARVEPLAPLSPFARQVLLTEYLPGTRTLTAVLRDGELAEDAWRGIGAAVARMHAAGVDHADLNAHNILLDREGGVYLIDFDRGRLRPAPGEWRARNVARLRRSLDKLSSDEHGLHFDEADWAALQSGYRNASDRAST
jgi:3-deoxy-D-manno-octulosonic acid kinase